MAVRCDAMSKQSVAAALEETLDRFGTVHQLVNGAGGSHPTTTTSPDLEFFDIDPENVRKVMDLNYLTGVIPSQAVGRVFAENREGAVVNITSIGGAACPWGGRSLIRTARPRPTASRAGSPCTWRRPTRRKSASTPSPPGS